MEAFAPYGSAHMLDDMAAAVGGYLYSELDGETITSVEDAQADKRFLEIATPQEVELLERREQEMDAISSFDWAREHAGDEDHINFFA